MKSGGLVFAQWGSMSSLYIPGNQTGTDSIAQFLQTVARYRDLKHPGVAPITGVCITVSDDPIVVHPYAQSGDLKSYVRDSNRVGGVFKLCMHLLLCYLFHEMSFVTRNCVVGDLDHV